MAQRSLEEFVEEVSGPNLLRVEHDYGDGFVRLRSSEAERRQAIQDIRCSEDVVLELLRNSRDAHAANIYLAVSREGNSRSITVIDDGVGIPEAMHALIFEPRVTSKLDSSHIDKWGLHGRGMALYSISVNATDAFVADSDEGLGCAICVKTDLRKLSEKTDQSSFPTFTLEEEGRVVVRGPRNMLRTACEFALDSRGTCTVFVGSPAEVAATLHMRSMSMLSSVERVFCRDPRQLPLVKRLATSADPESLAELAGTMGLNISARTARRIIDGEYFNLVNILDLIQITPQSQRPKGKRPKKGKSPRSVKLDRQDARALAEAAGAAYDSIAPKYYLARNVEPSVKSSPGKITITIPAVEDTR